MLPELPSDIRAHRDWLLSLAPTPEEGLWVDLGCGTGTDIMTLAARHPQPGLRFVGLDGNTKSIDTAMANGAGDSRIAFRQHQFDDKFPFDAATADVVYSNNLLECLGNFEAFAREVARILKPNGRMVMAHWDWDSQLFDATDKALVWRLVHAFADWQQAWMDQTDGWMGRRLWGIFNSTGLFEGSIHARVLTNTIYTSPWFGHEQAQVFQALVRRNLATADDYRRFIADQETLSTQGRYFYSITGFAYVARLRAV